VSGVNDAFYYTIGGITDAFYPLHYRNKIRSLKKLSVLLRVSEFQLAENRTVTVTVTAYSDIVCVHFGDVPTACPLIQSFPDMLSAACVESLHLSYLYLVI
jgi:hypothetical protein